MDTTTTIPDLPCPADADALGRAAYATLARFLAERGIAATDLILYTGPAWKARGESYGHGAALVVVHDGAPAGRFLSMDKAYWTGRPGCYDGYEALQESLRAAGLYMEDCTVWYTAIYEDKPIKWPARTAAGEV